MARRAFTWGSFFLRFFGSLLVVFATFNPSGYSYFHWARDVLPNVTPLLALCGLLLVVGWIMFLRASGRSIGAVGMLLAAAVFGVVLWFLIDIGWVPLDNRTTITYSVLVIISAVIAVGMSWSHVRRRVSGQFDVDDVEQ